MSWMDEVPVTDKPTPVAELKRLARKLSEFSRPLQGPEEDGMYAVRADDQDQFILYKVEGADWLVIAWFTTREDAEFAREAFNRREG